MKVKFKIETEQPLADLIKNNEPGTLIKICHPNNKDHNKLTMIVDDNGENRLLSLDEKFDLWGDRLQEYTGTVFTQATTLTIS